MEKQLKILAIGNSFSVDGMTHLYKVAMAAGYKPDQVILGNLYIGGCSLETHWKNAEGNLPAYEYFKNTNNEWINTPETSILSALKEEEWDYISLQQVSQNSGLTQTFEPYLTNLINYVNQNKTNTNAKLMWHSTWSYSKDSTHGGFANYDNNQEKMTAAIFAAADYIKSNYPQFSFVIPSGRAIANAREKIGDHLNRDGFHLDLTHGRLTAALTWFHKITEKDINCVVNDIELLTICSIGADNLKETGVNITAKSLLQAAIASAQEAVKADK